MSPALPETPLRSLLGYLASPPRFIGVGSVDMLDSGVAYIFLVITYEATDSYWFTNIINGISISCGERPP